MKTSHDPRHLKRRRAMRELFTLQFNPSVKPEDELVKSIAEKQDLIDKEIEKAAPSWPIAQINPIDLSILRLSIFELIIVKGVPYKVIVDEAVELAKEFGSESSPGFVNGVLGSIISTHGLDKEN